MSDQEKWEREKAIRQNVQKAKMARETLEGDYLSP